MDLKLLLIAVLAVTVATLGTACWLRSNLDRLIKNAIETQGSQMTGVMVHVGAVNISLLDGRGELSNLMIGNPRGFKSPYALKVERVLVAVDLASLAREVVSIHRIDIHEPHLMYEMGATATNFAVIQKNITASPGANDKAQAGKRMLVEHFSLHGANVEVSAPSMNLRAVGVPLADLTLVNVGRDTNGVTAAEFSQLVTSALIKKLTGAYSFERALDATGNTLSKAGKAIKDLFK